MGMVLLFGWIDWAGLASWGRPRALWLAAFAAAAAFAAVGVRAWWPGSIRALQERSPGVGWWTVVAAAVVVGAVAWGATSWLLSEADQASTADAKAAAKVDAIKTGLGIGAGTTGVFALLLAVRRQTHQERAVADTTHDATERRVTELYTKAADQLGSPKAAVRLAGLYALERLGDDHESQRVTIVNVICAYLQMRYAEPAQPSSDASPEQLDRYEDRVQEAPVRLAAQNILSRHRVIARREGLIPPRGGRRWDIELNLSGANLGGADFAWTDLTAANLNDADLTRANLALADLQQARLVNARLVGANLSGAHLLGALLHDADLSGAYLSRARFLDAGLRNADLSGADLSDAHLIGADLEGANLGGANLRGALLDDARVTADTRIKLPACYEVREQVVERKQAR